MCQYSLSDRGEGLLECLNEECSLWDDENKQCSDLTRNLAINEVCKILDAMDDRIMEDRNLRARGKL